MLFISLGFLLVDILHTHYALSIKVIVAGGGPAGLLAANCLLSRNSQKFDVLLVESRDSPNKAIEGGSSRSYSLGLNIRGQNAIKHFDSNSRPGNLLSLLSMAGVLSDSFFLHIGKFSIQLRRTLPKSIGGVPPTLLISRTNLCNTIYTSMTERFSKDGRFQAKFKTKILSVDLNNRRCILDDGTSVNYDLLVGSDGVNSIIRNELNIQRKSDGFISEQKLLPGKFKVMIHPCPSALDASSVHSINSKEAGFSLFLIPASANTTCVLISWTTEDPPDVLREWSSPQAIRDAIIRYFPKFGDPSVECLAQLGSQRPSEALTVRCNKYHDSAGRLLLLGDAAHSTGGTLGQGANSALQDVVTLDRCLDETNEDLDLTLPLFSRKAVPEGMALWELLQLPPRGIWGGLYALLQAVRLFLAKRLGSWLDPPTQVMLSQSLIPFSVIAKKVYWNFRNSTIINLLINLLLFSLFY